MNFVYKFSFAYRALLLVITPMTLAVTAHAQCLTAPVEIKSASTNADKCGFEEWECQRSDPPKYYLVNTYIASLSASETSFNGSVEDDLIVGDAKYTIKDIQTCDPNTCDISDNWSGTA